MAEEEWNTISSWEEPVEIEGLTLWDIHRPKLSVLKPTEIVTVEKNKIDNGLHCPVCMSILKKTKVVMTCLHRFCEECIDKCLRMNNNECPACRAHVPSRRSLRYDRNFDKLIEAIFGDVEEADKAEMKKVKRINANKLRNNAYKIATQKGLQNQEKLRKRGKKAVANDSDTRNESPRIRPQNKTKRRQSSHNNDNDSSSVRAPQKTKMESEKSSRNILNPEGASFHSKNSAFAKGTLERRPAIHQQQQLRQSRRSHPKAFGSPPKSQASYQQQAPTNAGAKRNMEFILERHPEEALLQRLDRSYIRTDSRIPARVLKKFLRMKLKCEDHIQFCLSLRSPIAGSFIDLPDDMTMEYAADLYNVVGNELTIYYRSTASHLSTLVHM